MPEETTPIITGLDALTLDQLDVLTLDQLDALLLDSPLVSVDLRIGLRAAFLGHAPLAALVGSRVRPGYLDQEDSLPALTYLVISDVDEEDLDGADGTKLATVQVDCWAERLDVANRLDRLAWRALKLARDSYDLGGVSLRWLAPEGDSDAVTVRGDGSTRAYARVRSEVSIRYHAPTD